jgi:hypothetical protein
MNNEKDGEEMIRTKAEFFLKNKIKVHIKHKNKMFWNGLVIKKTDTEDVYIFEDNVLGNVFLFLKDVYDIEEMRK